MLLKSGTIVDGTIISGPTSTKNATQSRDPEMQQGKNTKQWDFGMQVHIGAGEQGLVHNLVTGLANEAGITKRTGFSMV